MAKANWISDPLIGQQLANFRIEKVIGRGGMATVYQGLDIVLNRPVAVKVIHQLYRDNPIYTRRMKRESQMIATWRHPNIVQVYYADFDDDVPYFVMEYVDGPDLRNILDGYHSQKRLMPIDDVLRIGDVLADALDFAHKQGVIHRDIKPSNIMVSRTGSILLADFGLALEMAKGTIGESFGTPHYMAPEQAKQASDAIPASDLYSLGVILYEMLTGHLPFESDAITGVIIKSLTADLPDATSFNTDLPEAINDVFRKALSREIPKRYKTGREFVNAIKNVLGKTETLEPLERLVTHQIEKDKTETELIKDPSLASRLVLSLNTNERLNQIIGQGHTGKEAYSSYPATHPDKPEAVAEQILQTGLPTRVIWPWILSGTILLGGLIAGGLIYRQANVDEPAGVIAVIDDTPTTTITTTIDVLLTEFKSDAPMTETPLPPVMMTTVESTASVEVINAVEATETMVSTPIPTASATPTNTPSPTATRIENPDLILIYESQNAMYVYNPTDEDVGVSLISFTAMDDKMNLLPWSYNGRFWGRTTIEPDKCNALEVGGPRPELRDPRCMEFNWINNPGSRSTAIFWVDRPDENVEVFGVFWGGELVRTCAISSRVCRVELPEG